MVNDNGSLNATDFKIYCIKSLNYFSKPRTFCKLDIKVRIITLLSQKQYYCEYEKINRNESNRVQIYSGSFVLFSWVRKQN